MITALIFFAHIIFALVIFTKKWQEDSLTSAFLNLGLIGVLFSVGWSISGIIAKLMMEPKGLGIQFDRDAFSLTILIIGEYYFYKTYYKEPSIEVEKEKQ